MIVSISVLCFLAVGIQDVLAITKLCYSCHQVSDPSKCTHLVKCAGHEKCYSNVQHIGDRYVFSKGCTHECHTKAPTLIIGKRQPGPHEPAHNVACQQCCDHNQCNRHGCDNSMYMPTTTEKPTTTTPPPPCRDHEGNGFLCSDYSQYNLCTDASSFVHKLAWERCAQFCGFCDVNGNFKVTPPATFAPTTAMATGAPTTEIPSPTVPTSTSELPTPTTTAAVPLYTDMPDMTTTADVPSPTATAATCVDKEDSGFTCSQWASYGFCAGSSGAGHDIAVERCSKYCGFCS